MDFVIERRIIGQEPGGQTPLCGSAAEPPRAVWRVLRVTDTCHRDVATDGVREASQSYAFDSPSPSEHTDV